MKLSAAELAQFERQVSASSVASSVESRARPLSYAALVAARAALFEPRRG